MATAGEHKRACFNCGNVAMHVNNYGEYVRCQCCGSMDTRPVRKKPAGFMDEVGAQVESLDQSHRGGIEIVRAHGHAVLNVSDGNNSVSVELAQDGIRRLVAELQAVLEGGV